MAQVSKYEDIAQVFLDDNPIGSMVTGEHLLEWTEQKADGHTIGADLSIEDPRKRLSTLRRHLNDGARTQNVPEDRRFIVVVEDAKRSSFAIRAYADAADERAAQAFIRSAGAALAPLDGALKMLDDVKRNELSPEKQQRHDGRRQDIETIRQPVAKAYRDEADRRAIGVLIASGQTEQQARASLANLHVVAPYQKLLRKLT
jgi:hypothetical protein